MMNRRSSAPELSPSPPVDVDPELAVLPRPPQKERTLSLALMILTASLAVVLGAGLFGDVRYALSSANPEDAGELASLVPDPTMGNRFIRGQGSLDSAAAVRYETIFGRELFELAPLAGNRRIWVEMRVPDGEIGKVPPPTTFVGRLVPLDSAAFRIRSWRVSGQLLSGAAGRDAWVLIDGAAPASLSWAVGLFGLLLAFAGYNLVTIARIVRRVR